MNTSKTSKTRSKCFRVVEKNNPLAVHVICDTRERAECWIRVWAPLYCRRKYFTDKTLTPDSFKVRED